MCLDLAAPSHQDTFVIFQITILNMVLHSIVDYKTNILKIYKDLMACAWWIPAWIWWSGAQLIMAQIIQRLMAFSSTLSMNRPASRLCRAEPAECRLDGWPI